MFNGGTLLFADGLLAMSSACCCTTQCCAVCPWLYDYWFANGKLKVTFTAGPITGYSILAVTSTISPNSCLEWIDDDNTNIVDPCFMAGGGPSVRFWCESTGASLEPFKIEIGLGSGGCEITNISDPPEFTECTDAVAPDPYGTLTVRWRFTMGDLFPGGCDPCGGLPQDIVIEITRFP